MTLSPHAQFVALHDTDVPLLLPNAWDAASARLWQEAGATAIATTSAAVAWALGYADGGKLPREELLASLRGMLRVVSVPVTVDIEDGYSDDPRAVAELARAIAGAGAVGVNIEDGGSAPTLLVDKIRAIREAEGAAPLFVNARTDVYLRGLASGDEAVAMAIERLVAYRDAGADGGFVPGLASAEDAAKIVAAVPGLAINVMAMPGLASLDALAQAGVRRISAGPAFFRHAYGTAEVSVKAWLDGDFAPSFANGLDYARMNAMFL
ncbi:isocitrate lyase/phosphoenolpyruvate mutase family protein [Luteimonas soli]|uniref:Isocitrate lyase/phosphoenolpyruvate mutase family protein n=1 Tax=Luteimonas soli TaxID=1648966 RepID=A0ABV7XPT0_9GAMM